MNYEQFICAMLECTRKKLSQNYSVEKQEVWKNNGVSMTGLSIREMGKEIAPVIYLEEYYRMYLAGCSMEDLADLLLQKTKNMPKMSQWTGKQLTDFRLMKDKIAYKLVNAGKNEKLLKEIPSLPLFDLAIVFYLHLPISETENGSILIKNAHRNLWKCPISALYEYAKENTPGLCPAVLCPLTELLNDHGKERQEEYPVFVLTNRSGIYGAAALLYPGMPKHIFEMIGGSYYMLPSSVHEFLIIPEKNGTAPSELTAMVREVNRTEIAKDEFLSDQIYYFNGEFITEM